jgi:hypothetical protein
MVFSALSHERARSLHGSSESKRDIQQNILHRSVADLFFTEEPHLSAIDAISREAVGAGFSIQDAAGAQPVAGGGRAHRAGDLARHDAGASHRLLGNYPQGYTHLALIRSALTIERTERSAWAPILKRVRLIALPFGGVRQESR